MWVKRDEWERVQDRLQKLEDAAFVAVPAGERWLWGISCPHHERVPVSFLLSHFLSENGYEVVWDAGRPARGKIVRLPEVRAE